MEHRSIVLTTIGMLLVLIGSAVSQERVTVGWYCDYYGRNIEDDVYTFNSDQEAEAAIKQIVEHTGLVQNFIIRAANVPNATATIVGDQLAIFYSQDFMRRVTDVTQTDWAAISILAHEIGHHLQGHTIQAGGSRPPIELEADRYSGFVLQRMGASLDQARIAMEMMGSDQGSDTHPPRSARLAAITNGWSLAQELANNSPDTSRPAETNPTPQVPPVVGPPGPTAPTTPMSPTPQYRYVARCVFPSDPVAYFVTSKDDIVGVPPNGRAILVGRRIRPNYHGFAWMYQTAYFTYGVGSDGVIYSRAANGMPIRIGYVTNP